LRLDSAGITDAGVTSLSSIRDLKMVNLYHTLVSEKGFAQLKKAQPECEIVWERESSLPNRRRASEQK